jgi:8-oxo-dGTP pyrophosphatase MutT (NUDIX family)
MPVPGAKPDAVVAVVTRAGQVLVIRRAPRVSRPGYWAPLSGRIEPGESQAEAVVREVREEVGLAVMPIAKVWQCETDDGAYHLHWWTARAGPGELTLQVAEVSDARWIDPEAFGELAPTFADDRAFFAHVFPTLSRTR